MSGAIERQGGSPVKRLLALLHRHKWEPLKWNRYGIAFEQRCRCGKVRHTTWNGFDWNTCRTSWFDGPHP
jgi:hypothetical protein